MDEDICLDFLFNLLGSDFCLLWLLIFNVYIVDYQDVVIDGSFMLDGLVKGIYNEIIYLVFCIKMSVKDGNVKYLDLFVGIFGIQVDLDVNSLSVDLDQMVVKVDQIVL